MSEMQTTSLNPAFVIAAKAGKQWIAQGLHITEKVSSAATNGAYYVFEMAIPPGAGLPLHVHTREDELFVVLEGSIDVSLGRQQIKAGPGDVLNFARGTPHGLLNRGTVNARLLNTVIPGANFAQFFQEMAEAETRPNDSASPQERDDRYGMSLVLSPQEGQL